MPRRKTAGVSPGKLAVGNAPRSHAELPCYTGVQSVAAKEDLLLRGCGLAPRRKNCETNDGERKDGSQTEPNLRYLHKKFKKMAEAVGAEAGGGAVESNGGGGGGGGAEVRGGAVAPVAMEAPSADTSPVEASPPPPASPPSTSNDASSSSSSSSSEESKRRAAAATPGAAAATGAGRHICPYCKLACAKPSVLQKHVRAHTNERPYPCRTCGFAFKTKSNLYKHCRSRSHALKAERPSSAAAAALPGAEDDEEDEEEVSNGVSGEEEEEEGVEEDDSPREESGSSSGGGGYGGTGKTSPMEDQECQSVAASLANSRPRTIYKPKFHTAALYRDEEEQQQQSQQCRAMAEGAGGGPSAPMSSEREAPPSQPPPPAASAPSQEYLRRHVARIIDENRAIVEGGDRTAWAKKRVWGGQRAPAVANSRPGPAPSPHTESPPPPRPSDPGPESRLALALLRPAPEQPLNLSRAGPDRARWDPSRAPLRKESPSPSPLQPTLPKTCPLCRAQFRDEESLEAHRMCYCEGRGPPSYARKASGAEAEDVGHMMGACLPSPGPLLGNTPLVDGYNPPGIPAPKVGPPPKKRRTDPQPSPRSIRHSAPEYEGPSSVLRGGMEDAREQSPSAMLPATRPSNAVHLFGGEVRIREGSETKTLRIEVGGRGGANREVLRGEEGGGGAGAAGGAGRDGDTVVTIARSGLHSGGTIVHVRKTSSCEEDAPTVRRPKAKAGGRRSLAPSPTGESSPPSSLSLPIAPQISTPDLAPDLRAPFGPFPHHDGVLLGYDHPPPSPSLRARPSPPRPSPSSSGVLTIFHGGRAVPFVPGMPGPQGTPPLLVLPARTPLDLGPPLPEGKDHSPHPNHVFAAEASREATPPPPRQQPPPPPPPPPPPRVSPVPPQASPTPTRAENDSTAPEDQKKKSRFLRPTSLPLKPGTYPLKKHSQGNTPLGIGSSGASLVSPETPRPRKSYGQLYLNGHAYTYLGLKCSTRPSFCCAHRRPPQPMYVAQGPAHPRLSMYSNWKVCEAVTAEPFGLEPGKAMRLYDSRHRPSDTSVAPSQSDGSNAMILTHSSYWLLKKERDVLGEKEETVEVKEEAVDMEEKMDKENGKSAATSVKSERTKESEQQCTKSSADAEGQSQPPARVKIFAGGFESNEEYIYVRGRGRGRYVCEECGIRCKKPSMLKKHIRTHTDVRPFTCRHCCFSFKTKGNLTKHMKSKAHFKKCVEMGIVPVPTTVDESHIDEESLAKQQAQRAASLAEGESESDDDDDEEDDEEEEEDEEDEEDNADGADSSKGKMEQEEREVARSLLSLSESIDPTNGIGRLPPPPPPEPVSSYAPQSGLTPLLSRPRSYPYLSHLPDQSISPPLPAEEKARVLPPDADVVNPESHIFPSSSSSTMVAVASGQRYYFPSRRDAQAQEKVTEESVNAVKTPTPLRLSVRDASPSAGTPVFNATNIDPADQDANEMEDGVNGGSYGPVDLSTGGGAGGSLPSTPEDRGPRIGWRVRGQEREEAIRARNAGQPAFILASVLPHSPYGTLPGTPTTPVREHPSEILAPVPSDSAALLASLCSTVNKLPQSTLDASSGGGSVATTPTMDDNTPGGGTMLQAYLTERALQDVRLKRQQRSPFHPLGRDDQVEPVPMTGTCNVITSVGPSAISLPPGVVSKVVSMTHSPRIVDSPLYEVAKAAEAIQEVQVKVCETIPRKDWSETERENGEVNVYCASTASTVARVIERPCVVSSNHSSASPVLRQTKTAADAHSAGESNSITPVGSSEMMKLSHVVGPRVPSCSPKAEFMPPLSGPSSSYTGVTEDGRSMCAICHKVFSKASQLRLHVNIHYFERPFRCDSCAVSFRTRGHLQKHQRSVSHQNKVSMNSTFGMPTTENPRPFKCGDCKIAFRIHGHLAKHLRSKMHIMRLECVGKLPFGTYAEVERSGISLADIDTSDCENSLESLQMLAQKLYEKDPTKLQHWERTRALSESSEDEGMGYHRDESGHGIPVPNGPLHGGTLMRPSVLEQTASRRAFCGTLTSDYEDASDGESHLMLQPQLTRSFICDFCDAGFTSKQLLQNHLLVHQQSPPDNCL
ncbi:uncharacterized protein LOC124154296 isoform X2 [Ischnura elegans]|uniref:uncharacterized protein LOC124154296 isoform X2 n=1 Tax=Ischnura elegans TaxID=197161 RepID=UPI001ED8BE20|nr:uncharacterized protein LOC124154296 isoform X2 [Ischnura elegans]